MAEVYELLVRLKDRPNITWVQQDRPGEVDAVCSRTGDIISIREEGRGWGKDEQPPEYIRLKLLTSATMAKQYKISIYKEVFKELDRPKLDYIEDKTVCAFKYDAEILLEYVVPTYIKELDTWVDVDWVKLRGMIDVVKIRRKYFILNIEQYKDFDTILVENMVSKE